ncbi:MAG: branched-chain amino acid ABC transporter permease [Planctomycetes bacterium]|nr:branched-chain amino acid ABC transporter permease [Planctomycetota bacterium]
MSNIILFLASVIALMGIYALLTLAVNLHYGYAGLLSFGIVGFAAVGAYTYAIVTRGAPVGEDVYLFYFNQPWWVGFLAAGVVTTLFAFIIGLPTLRVEGDYLLIVTFAFAEVIQDLLSNEGWLTNGTRGFINIHLPFRELIPGRNYTLFLAFLIVVIVAVVYLIAQRLGTAPFGRTLRAIRDNEPAALAVGKSVFSFKMRVFLLGAAICGFAGAMYTWYMTLAMPSIFGMSVSFAAWIALMVGGQGNNKGAIVGTIVLLGVQQAFKFISLTPDMAPIISSIQLIMEGLVLIVILRFWPSGLLPEKSPRPPKPAITKEAI